MSDGGSARSSWSEDRGPWWIASIAVILLVLAGVAGVLLWGGDSGDAAGQTSTTSGTSAGGTRSAGTSATTAATTSSRCGLPPATTDTVPTQPPPQVHWSVVNTVALPWSQTDGPATRHGAVWTCYARTATGALMAATVLSVTPDSPQGAQVLQQQALPGPNQQARLNTLREQPPPPARPGETAAIAGFRIVDYTPDRAAVQLAGALGGRYLVVTVYLVWQGDSKHGDWKLNLDPPGGVVPGQPLQSLAGFIPWGAR